MTKKHRIEYLVCTWCVFFSGLILYGLVAAFNIPKFANENRWITFLGFGCLGGFGFSMLVSTIILSAGFFKKRGLVFKIIASVLFPLTFGVCVYVGVFTYIPYQIYNIVKIVSLTHAEKQQKNKNSEEQKTITDK